MSERALSANEWAGLEVPAANNDRRRFRIADLPKPILCIPLVAQWLWLALRYRSLTLPSCLNPAIETGGLAGESKAACLAQIGAAFASHVARWVRIGPGEDAVAGRVAAGIAYPVVAKPDIGWCGYGVRRIENDAGMRAYAASFPTDAGFIVQRLVAAPYEAGLFYVRRPGAARGRILAMTLRHGPHVVGDGARSVADLAGGAGGACGARVPAAGERVMLTTVASLRVGATYEDATALLTEALQARVDAIARSMPEFHVGRFDVRFGTMPALQAGTFQIIEVNGAGSEAIHLWDPALPIGAAFAGVFAKQRMLFEMGAAMRARGHRPVGAWALAAAWCAQQRLIARYPESN